VPLITAPTPENLRYLRTKRAKLGHIFPDNTEVHA
jgi:GTP cyclohydrolase II